MEAKRASSRRFYARNAEVMRARRMLRYYETRTAALEYEATDFTDSQDSGTATATATAGAPATVPATH